MNRVRSRAPIWLAALLAIIGSSAASTAQLVAPPSTSTSERIAPVAAKAAHPLTAQDLDAWLDGIMPYALASNDIAGAAVVVVRGGEVVTQRGWGFADVAARRPVDPDRTVFRTGSVGKLFTWTAVMQLVEQGRLDLDADINRYLDFRIPPRDGRPITMRNLMTHTPGFEEHVKNLVTSKGAPPPLRDYVRRWTPERIYAPGRTIAYSNYGVTLAGYIVERVSGTPYDDYIERNIFKPLGMSRSTPRQPLPADFQRDAATGYMLGSGPAMPFELFAVGPAGGHSATAADMGRFMSAYLGRGRLGEASMLRPETVALMWKGAFAAMPPLPPMGLGFFRDDRNGRTVLGHSGDSQYFHSVMQLVPQEDVGFFIVMNSTGELPTAAVTRGDLFRAFMDRYFPDPRPAAPTMRTAADHAQLIAGRYTSSRRGESSFISMLFALGETQVVPNSDGTITVSLLLGADAKPKKWREVAPFVWQEAGGSSRIAARLDNGRVVAFATDDLPVAFEMQRTPAAQSMALNLPLLAISLLVMLYTLIARPMRAVVKRRRGQQYMLHGRAAVVDRLSWPTALVNLLFVGGFVGVLAAGGANLTLFGPGLDPILRALQLLGLLAIVGGAIALWNLVLVWRDRAQGWSARIGSALFALACLGIVWIAFTYKLLSPSLDY
jgi:CubicO group peptidase (beta-lactamase class C family)